MKNICLILVLIMFFVACDSFSNSFGRSSTGYQKDKNAFIQTVIDRRSVRKYKQKRIDEATINEMLELAKRAPSAGNLQAYKIYIVTNNDVIRTLADAALGQKSVYSAPQVLVFVALPEVSAKKYKDRGRLLYALQDATIVAAYTQLIIQNYGFSSVWIGAFRPDEVSSILGLDENQIPVAIIPFGFSDETLDKRSKRKPLVEIVNYIR